MEVNKDIRWKQRFDNLEKVYLMLEKYLQIENPSDIERAGGIHLFELCFELSWKTMKDFLESEGFQLNSPRNVIKQAFQSDLIDEGHLWIDLLDDRNLYTHIYDEKIANEIDIRIKGKYYQLIKRLCERFKEEKKCTVS